MNTIIRTSMVLIDNNLLKPETYDMICETGDISEGLICDFGSEEIAINSEFTPETDYCKVGKDINDITWSQEEKDNMFKFTIDGTEYPIPRDQIVFIPVVLNSELSEDDILYAGMTPIKDIEILAKNSSVYADILKGYKEHVINTKKCVDTVRNGAQISYQIYTYDSADFMGYFFDVKAESAEEIDTNKFLAAIFVSPMIIPDCENFVDENGKSMNLDEFKYGAFIWKFYYEDFDEYTSPNAISNVESLSMVVDYNKDYKNPMCSVI